LVGTWGGHAARGNSLLHPVGSTMAATASAAMLFAMLFLVVVLFMFPPMLCS
jgi:hypothetical protein